MQVTTIDTNLNEESGLDAVISVMGFSGMSISELDIEDVLILDDVLSDLADSPLGSGGPGETPVLDGADMERVLRHGARRVLCVDQTGDLLIQAEIQAESHILFIPSECWELAPSTTH